MSTNTENYNLIKPAEGDFYDIGVQNGNMDIVDGALKGLDDRTEVLEDAVNSPDFNTIELTALEQIKSVTDSYGGVAEFIASGTTLFQAVTNGDFSNVPTDLFSGNSTSIVSGGILTNTGDGTNNEPRTTLINRPSGKNFVKIRVRSINSECDRIQIRTQTLPWGSAEIFNPEQNKWYGLFAIIDSGQDNITYQVRHRYATSALANGKSIELDYIMAIPITGTPYENMTAEEINAHIGTYWEGLKSTEETEVASRGRNLFDGSKITKIQESVQVSLVGGKLSFTTLAAFNGVRITIPIKPNTQYTMSWVRELGDNFNPYFLNGFIWLDGELSQISSTGDRSTVVNSFTANSPSGAKYVRFIICNQSATTSTLSNLQLTESSTALPFEPFQGSKAKITCTDKEKFDLALLPNGVQNTVEYKDGKYRAVKRVSGQRILSGEQILAIGVDGLTTTRFENTTSLAIRLDIDKTIRTITTPTNDNANIFIKNVKFSPIAGWGTGDSRWGVPNLYNTGATLSSGKMRVTLSLAHSDTGWTSLPSLQQVKDYFDANNLTLQFELATPITIEEKDFSEYGIEVDGLLTSNNDFTEFYTDNYDLFSPTEISYSTNLAKAVENQKEALQGLREMNDFTVAMLLNHEMRISLLEI